MSDHAATPNRWITSPRARAYVYRILLAVGALALFYGYVTAEALPLWLALAAELLGTGLALANTPTEGK